MEAKNLSVFSLKYWKLKLLFIWEILVIFWVTLFPNPESKGIRTREGHYGPDGRYTNKKGSGSSSNYFGGCSGGS